MEQLKATKRGEQGTRKARKLRRDGQIPAVIYGHGKDPQSVTLKQHDVELVMHHGERLLEIDLEGQIENVLLKDVQYDAFGQEILHLDLARVDLNEMVTVTVPIVLRGTPAGAAEGGVLQQIVADVEIECMVRNIPDDIRAAVNELKVGDVLHMRDLPLPEGAKLKSDPETIVCSVTFVAEEVAAPAAEGEAQALEPEVITERKPAEGEEEEAAKEEGKKGDKK